MKTCNSLALLLCTSLLASGLAGCGGAQVAPGAPPTAADCSDVERQLAEARAQLAAATQSADAQRLLAEDRARIQAMLEQELAGLIQAGRVRIVSRRGLLVIQLPNRVLFESGRAAVSTEGTEAITEVGTVLAQVQNRRFLVSGHTDNRPIQSQQFPSNWELSTARGIAVLRILLTAGVGPEVLGAGGFGEHDPVGGNDTDEGRAENRRTELVLIPNLEQILGQRRN